MTPDFLLALVGNGTGRITAEFLISCLQGLRSYSMEIAYVSDGPYIGRARNAIASYFLQKTAIPKLVFIDMDIKFSPTDFQYLLEGESAIVGGVYYIKSAAKHQVAAIRKDKKPPPDGFRGRLEVARTGTGFMAIHRRVFLELVEGLWVEPYRDYERKRQWNFFPMPITNEELLSEDWGFCDVARKAGFKIWLDTRIQLLHEGTALYPFK